MQGKIDIREFVPKEVYNIYGEKSSQFVNRILIFATQQVYNYFNTYCFKKYAAEEVKIVINDWHEGGKFNWRGLRTWEYINQQKKAGVKIAEMSQHIGGSANAVDYNIWYKKNGKWMCLNDDEVFDEIIKNEKLFLSFGITTLEDKTITTGWTHMDCRYTGLDKIFIVKPK